MHKTIEARRRTYESKILHGRHGWRYQGSGICSKNSRWKLFTWTTVYLCVYIHIYIYESRVYVLVSYTGTVTEESEHTWDLFLHEPSMREAMRAHPLSVTHSDSYYKWHHLSNLYFSLFLIAMLTLFSICLFHYTMISLIFA